MRKCVRQNNADPLFLGDNVLVLDLTTYESVPLHGKRTLAGRINSRVLKIILDYWGGNGIKGLLLRGRLEGQRQNRRCDKGSTVRRERERKRQREGDGDRKWLCGVFQNEGRWP